MLRSDKKKLLILGIDPGTTIGYAILDLNANLIKLASSKQLNLSSLISTIIQHGKPLIVGCDVTPAPRLVAQFAIKTGSKLIHPEQDLSTKEKRQLTKPFQAQIKNIHQQDALSSALYAFAVIQPLLSKIDRVLKKEKKQHLSTQTKELLIKRNIPIKTAIEILEKPEKEEVKIIKKVFAQRILLEKDFLTLYNKLKKSEKDIKLLNQQNTRLKQEAESAKSRLRFLLKKFSQLAKKETASQLLYFKQKTINALSKELQSKKTNLESLKKELADINKFISNLNENYLLKKLDNIGSKEFETKNKQLNIQKDDILLVNNLDIYSQKTIDALKDKINLIIFKKASKKTQETMPFSLIDAKKLKIKENNLFASINKKDLEKEKSKIDILTKIVKEYRKERV